MALVVGRMVALLEAQTAQFEARMAAAGQQMNKLTSTSGSARQGLSILRGGLQNFAAQGLGALPGPLARVATGLGTLAFGSPLVIGVLAAGAAITAVFKAHGAEAAAAAERIKGYQAQLQSLVTQGKPIAAISTQITDLLLGDEKKKLRPLEEVEEDARRLERAVLSGAVGKGGEDRLRDLQSEIALRRQIIAILKHQQELERENVRLGFAAAQAAAAERQARLLALGLEGRLGERLGGGIGVADTLRDLRSAATRIPIRIPDELIRTPESVRAARAAQHEEQRRRMTEFETREPFQFTPEFGLQAGMAIVQGMQHGLGAGIGAAAGPLGQINPTLGTAASLVGGIFSLFDNSEERRAREAEAAAQRRHEELMEMLRKTEPIIITAPAGDFDDPRQADVLARAIKDLRDRRALPAAA